MKQNRVKDISISLPKVLGRIRKYIKFITKVIKMNLNINAISKILLKNNNIKESNNSSLSSSIKKVKEEKKLVVLAKEEDKLLELKSNLTVLLLLKLYNISSILSYLFCY